MQRLRQFFVGFLIFVLCVLTFPVFVSALPLSGTAVRLTRQAAGVATDLELAIVSPTGINADTDLIFLTFSPEFDLTALSASDISLSYGPTTGFEHSTSVQSLAAAGVWAYTRASNHISLNAPLDSGTITIPPGSRIVIRIGLWAGGSHQVINPPTRGVYTVTVGGTFGDQGMGSVVIIDSDSLAVTATVTAASEGGTGATIGGGGTGGAPLEVDGAPPVISGLLVERISATTAVVRWSTDEAADAYLEYGPTIAYGMGTRTRDSFATVHEFPLSELVPETEYHLRVRSRDVRGNTRVSSDFVFRTGSLPSVPTISEAEVTYVDDHQAIVRWVTNIDTTAIIELASSVPLGALSEPTMSRTHQIEIRDLVPGTRYSFRIKARAMDGAIAEADGVILTREDATPPSNVLNFRGVYNRTSGVVELSWINPSDADFNKVQITRVSETAGWSEVVVCTTPEMRCTDIPLPGVTNSVYRAVTLDTSGNPSTGALTSVRIFSATDPLPVRPTVGAVPGVEGGVRPTGPSVPVIGGVSDGVVLPPILRPDALEGGGGAGASHATWTERLENPEILDAPELVLVPQFFLSERVPASPDRAGIRSVLAMQPIQIRLPITETGISLREAQVQTSDGSLYQFGYRASLGAFVSDVTFSGNQTEAQFVQIQAIASDGRRWEGRFPFRILPPARVLDVSERNRALPVATATIELIARSSGETILRMEADADGRYAAIVPNGQYRLRVSKTDYRSYERSVDIEMGILVQDVELRRTLRPLMDWINPEATLRENISSVGNEVFLAAEMGLEAVRQPEVQEATREIVAPIAVVAAVGTTASAVTGFTLFNYLRFLFTQPLLLLRRRKRQSWGVVYNALSKQPIELAIVRLLKSGTNFAVQTRITDAQGRFSFFVSAGSYTLQIQKPGFQFPSAYLKEERIDVDFVDLYHGESIAVKEAVTISPNVPLDPLAKEETPKAITRKRRWRTVQSLLGVGGIFVGIAAVVINPSWLMAGFAAFQVLTYGLFRRLAIPPTPKRWGIVYDSDGKHPLTKAVVRIFDKKFNKLLETQITTKDGTYGFFASKGVYYLTAEKPGYERYLSADVDLMKAKDTYIDHRFSLKRVGATTK